MARHAAEDLVDVIGSNLQRLLCEDDFPGGDVACGHHIAPKAGQKRINAMLTPLGPQNKHLHVISFDFPVSLSVTLIS